MNQPILYGCTIAGLDLRLEPCATDSSVIGLGRALDKPVFEVWLLPGDKSPGFTPKMLARAGFGNIGEVVVRLVADGYPGTPLRETLRNKASIRVGSMTHWYYSPYQNQDGHLVISVCYGHPDVIHHVRADGYRKNGRHFPGV